MRKHEAEGRKEGRKDGKKGGVKVGSLQLQIY